MDTKGKGQIRSAESYAYPMGGAYAETVATLSDGRICTINTQYGCVLPHGEHAEDCEQLTKMGGRCTCGLLDGIDVEALVADARANGKRGYAPEPEPTREQIDRYWAIETEMDARRRADGLCPKCGTYCCGDCGL
ncbi:MAG: hypothetical protein WC565_08705 [Parcubacteria group bacterium]